jgi:flagellar biosynthesis protein FlhA
MERLKDTGLAAGLVLILAILILPMPRGLMDFALAISILFSFVILMTVLFIEKAVEFSIFPTILLVSTILRLALNLASTRLILSHGHEGVHAAGEVIYAFGSFIMGGNFVIGVIVFTILIIVNFIVITKGSGRIAEVSARFTLDALPGKQMAIDAELSAGMIDEKIAKQRRKLLENETNFYGSMDGAAKFVRGDAIAGVIITLINIIAGIIIGVVQKGIDLGQASSSYTLLTVGDGLVSQIPALIVSMAAGMLISKSGTEGATDKAFWGQLGGRPNALWMSAVFMGGLAVLPGIPKIPFLFLGVAVASLAYHISRVPEEDAADIDKIQKEENLEDSSSRLMQVETLRLEVGKDLADMIEGKEEDALSSRIKSLRRRFSAELGFILPPLCLQRSSQLGALDYKIDIREIECARGTLQLGKLLVLDPTGGTPSVEGETTTDPAFGAPAVWVDLEQREEAEAAQYIVAEPVAVLLTHLESVVRRNIVDLFSSSDMQRILDELPDPLKKVTAGMVPSQVSLGTLQRVFQSLLAENVSIRDVTTIMEALAEACSHTSSAPKLLEHVRLRLSRQLCFSHTGEDGALHMISFSPETEKTFSDALVGEGEVQQLSLAPSALQKFATSLLQVLDHLRPSGIVPVLVVSGAMRSAVRIILERIRPEMAVFSRGEIHSRVQLKIAGYV